MQTEREKQTQINYDLRPYEWLEYSGGKDRKCYWQKEMNSFLSNLGKDKKVLEIGCGPATDGKFLLSGGCKDVVSIDYSIGMLNMAKAILKTTDSKPQLCKMDAYNIGFEDNSFDGFWATAVFVHISEPKKVFDEIHRVLKPKGYGFLSVKEGEGERVDEKTGYYFHYFPVDGEDSISSTLLKTGFKTVNMEKRETPKYNWLTYLVQKK